MKRIAFGAIAATLCLSGCSKPRDADGQSPHAHGRYAGVGIYTAGRLWAQVVAATASKDPAAAKLSDDEQVIVVVDSNTGEIRQCGNLTGYCVGMSPWAKSLAGQQTVPILLAKHADDLAREAEAREKASAASAPR